MIRRLASLGLLAILGTGPAGADSPDLSEYKTVDTAATTTISRVSSQKSAALPAYLGVLLDPEARQDPVVAAVDADSPAALAGVQPGDVLLKLDGRDVKDGGTLMEILQGKSAGDLMEIALARKDKTVNTKATLTPWSKLKTAPNVGVPASACRSRRARTRARA